MQFAPISRGSLYPWAKLPKLATICTFGKLREIRRRFSNSDNGKWNSQNLQQIVQNLLNLPTVTINHVKFAQFAPISQGSLYPWAKLPKLAAICAFGKLCEICRPFSIRTMENGTPKIYSKLRKICSICPPSPQIMRNLCNLHQFPKVLCTHG